MWTRQRQAAHCAPPLLGSNSAIVSPLCVNAYHSEAASWCLVTQHSASRPRACSQHNSDPQENARGTRLSEGAGYSTARGRRVSVLRGCRRCGARLMPRRPRACHAAFVAARLDAYCAAFAGMQELALGQQPLLLLRPESLPERVRRAATVMRVC
eukprot:jgi/Ulvmu1/4288/UM002_0008.1